MTHSFVFAQRRTIDLAGETPVNRPVDYPSLRGELRWALVEDSFALPRILTSLRVTLHVLFAVLLAVAVVAAKAAGQLTWLVGTLVVLLAGVYFAGTLAEKRGRASAHSAPAVAWLLAILLLWAALVCQSGSFVWLLFPLVFLIPSVLPWIPAVAVTLVALLVAVGLPVLTGQSEFSVGGVVGPAIGTLAALTAFLFYRALSQEVITQRGTAVRLRATQEQLVSSEREAGRLSERERLAREIHDTLAQGLSSIVLLSRAAEKSLATDAETAAKQVRTINRTAADNLAEARRFVAGLTSPAMLDSVPDALAALVDKHRRQLAALGESTDLELSYTGDSGLAVPDDVAAAVIRVAQEASTNALRHADAHRVVITYGVWPDAATVDVVDDGRGFDPADTSGFGLPGLRSRVRELGGVLAVESAPGSGTAIAARFPLTGEHS